MAPIAAPARAGSDGNAGPASVLDGRARRRLHSYERAVDALLDLLEAGNPAPTAQEIAARSGISVRTVFRLTEDIETLHAAAWSRTGGACSRPSLRSAGWRTGSRQARHASPTASHCTI
jgi:IclR helix-turn-helix domain